LCDFIRAHREEILADWLQDARREFPAMAITEPRLVDHLPELLRQVADLLDDGERSPPAHLDELARLHALDRLHRGFDVSWVAQEYAVLRRAILRRYARRYGDAVRMDDVVRFNEVLDAAVCASVENYAHQRQRVLIQIDRLAAASSTGGSLHELLDQLLHVFVETSEAVDTSSILLLEDDGRLHLRASLGLGDEVKDNLTLAVGEGFAGAVAATLQPRALRDASQSPELRSPHHFKAAGVHALYGVPLCLREELIGVALMGSCTTFEFAEDDKVLFRTLADKATGFIYESKLRQAAERRAAELASVIEAMPDAVLIFDRSGAHTYNGAAMRMLPNGDRLLQQPTNELIETLDVRWADTGARPTHRDNLLIRALAGDGGSGVLTIRGDGERAFRAAAAPIRLRERVVGAVVIATDVTEQRRAETERQRMAQEVERERQLLEMVLRQVPCGVVIAEAGTERILMYNEASRRIWHGSVHGETLHDYERIKILGEDGTRMPVDQFPLTRALREGVSSEQVRLAIIRADGSPGWLTASAAPLRAPDGAIEAAVVAFMDISDLKNAEARLLEDAAFRERFVGMLGHDLRSPLSAISVGAQMLLRRCNLDDPMVQTLQRINASATRMGRMIRDILDFTRGRQSGGIPLQRAPANLHVITQEAAAEAQTGHPGRRFIVETEGDVQGVWDRDRLAQVVTNLVSNAVAHGAADSPVWIRSHGEEEVVTLEVTNLGNPIPPERLPHLFDPFRKSGSASSGLGLGLYIVQEIVRAHGGVVGVASSEAKGTTFTVRLPR
jgi:signal transduction histidine kinase